MKPKNVIIGTMITLSVMELLPYLITSSFPNICYGCTAIGKLHQYLNTTIKLAYISWFSYLLLFFYLIYQSSRFKNYMLKYTSIFLCLLMIYLPTIPLVNIITLLLCVLYENPPFIKTYHHLFPSSIEIEKKSDIIIREFKTYTEHNKPECIRKSNPGFIIENNIDDDNCWRALYLKKIGKIDKNMIRYFPQTLELIKDDQIHNAFFSILDPGVEIPPHVGYYKGYLRYHMGVVIPNNSTGRTDDKAYIVCGGVKYIWEESAGILFDDLFLHHVKNPTNQSRTVLYLDIKRKSDSYIVGKINELGIFLIDNSIVFNSFLKNQHSQNKINDIDISK